MPDRTSLFSSERRLLIGMVHLPPLLGQPDAPPLEAIESFAVREADKLARAGFDAVLVENFGDVPFYPDQVPPHTVAAMTLLAYAIREFLAGHEHGTPRLGINVLRNDARSALAIAAAAGADFVRVNVHAGAMMTDQGLIQGRAHETVRYRDQLAPDVAILADVHVKHAAPLVNRPIEEEAYELWQRARADGLIVTGAQTGAAVDSERLYRVRQAVGCPLLAGSGVAPDQLDRVLPYVDGLIVGTWLKEGGQVHRPIDEERAGWLVQAVRSWESAQAAQATQASASDDFDPTRASNP